MDHFAANQKAEFYGGVIATILVLLPLVVVIILWIVGTVNGPSY